MRNGSAAGAANMLARAALETAGPREAAGRDMERLSRRAGELRSQANNAETARRASEARLDPRQADMFGGVTA